MGCNVSRARMARFSLPANVMLVRARGREYYYHQRNRGTKRAGPRTPLAGCPFNPDGSPNDQWWTAYRQLEGVPEPAARAGSFLALIAAREISPEWAALSENTRTEWKRYHGIIAEAWGHLGVRALEPKHIKALRDTFADIPPADPRLRTKPLEEYKSRPAAANNLLRALSAAIAWGVPDGWRSDNPALLVPKLKGGDGYLPWPMRGLRDRGIRPPTR